MKFRQAQIMRIMVLMPARGSGGLSAGETPAHAGCGGGSRGSYGGGHSFASGYGKAAPAVRLCPEIAIELN
jgi:hypothetical protein